MLKSLARLAFLAAATLLAACNDQTPGVRFTLTTALSVDSTRHVACYSAVTPADIQGIACVALDSTNTRVR